MRLNQEQIKDIKKTVTSLATMPVKIFLFGSRTSNQKKGGDIDLLVVTDSPEALELQKIVILVQLKKCKSIGERKIDLIIASENQTKKDAFLVQAMSEAIELT